MSQQHFKTSDLLSSDVKILTLNYDFLFFSQKPVRDRQMDRWAVICNAASEVS